MRAVALADGFFGAVDGDGVVLVGDLCSLAEAERWIEDQSALRLWFEAKMADEFVNQMCGVRDAAAFGHGYAMAAPPDAGCAAAPDVAEPRSHGGGNPFPMCGLNPYIGT